MKPVFAVIVWVVLLAASPTFGSAVPTDVVEKRQAAMKAMANALRSGDPATVAQKSVELKLLFPEGSYSDSSEASLEIWKQPEAFFAIFDKLAADATAGASVPELGASCKACHDLYRVKKN